MVHSVEQGQSEKSGRVFNKEEIAPAQAEPVPEAEAPAPAPVEPEPEAPAPAAPVPEPEAPAAMSPSVPLPVIGGICAGFVVLVLVIAAVLNSGTTIKLDDYMTVETEGYDGYGTARSSIDWGAIEEKRIS